MEEILSSHVYRKNSPINFNLPSVSLLFPPLRPCRILSISGRDSGIHLSPFRCMFSSDFDPWFAFMAFYLVPNTQSLNSVTGMVAKSLLLLLKTKWLLLLIANMYSTCSWYQANLESFASFLICKGENRSRALAQEPKVVNGRARNWAQVVWVKSRLHNSKALLPFSGAVALRNSVNSLYLN